MKCKTVMCIAALAASACSAAPSTSPGEAAPAVDGGPDLAFVEDAPSVPADSGTDRDDSPAELLPEMSDEACVVVIPALNALGSLQALGPDDAAERVEASFAVLNQELSRLTADGPTELAEHAEVLSATYGQLTVLWASRDWDYRAVLADPVIAADLEMLATWRVTVAQDALTDFAPTNCIG